MCSPFLPDDLSFKSFHPGFQSHLDILLRRTINWILKKNKPNKTTFACHLSPWYDLHHFLSAAHSPAVFLLLSPLPALWKANEESWAEGSFCVLVKKNNLCQRKVLQQLCCRTCSLKGWRNFSGPTCRSRSANLYSSREPRIWDYIVRFLDARTTTNLPLSLCVCVYVCMCACVCVDRSCQGGATGISNKQQIIHVSILWPKHGCQIFVPFSSFWVQRRIWSDMLSVEAVVLYFSTSFTHYDNSDQSQFVHILNKAHSENLYKFQQDLCEQRDDINHSTGSSADLHDCSKINSCLWRCKIQ